MLTDAYPKLVPSSPLAMSVNCWAASLILLGDLDLRSVNTSLWLTGSDLAENLPNHGLDKCPLGLWSGLGLHEILLG